VCASVLLRGTNGSKSTGGGLDDGGGGGGGGLPRERSKLPLLPLLA
jgi:hypothetical protein